MSYFTMFIICYVSDKGLAGLVILCKLLSFSVFLQGQRIRGKKSNKYVCAQGEKSFVAKGKIYQVRSYSLEIGYVKSRFAFFLL